MFITFIFFGVRIEVSVEVEGGVELAELRQEGIHYDVFEFMNYVLSIYTYLFMDILLIYYTFCTLLRSMLFYVLFHICYL